MNQGFSAPREGMQRNGSVGDECEMDDGMDDFSRRLQQQIYEEIRPDYGEVALHRWLNPRYMGTMKGSDGHACVHGSCGDTMEIFLKFNGERVIEALFQTDGCGSSTICGSFAAEMAIGQTPDQLLDITGESILEKLGGIPENQQHCAFLAAETLQMALNDYMMRQAKRNTLLKAGIAD